MIEINMNPNIFQVGSLALSWHGLVAVLCVALVVFLTARWAPRYGITKDAVYETAVWILIAAVIGARVVAILDDLSYYGRNPFEVIAIWKGGVAIWGGLLGGLAGGVLYTRAAKLPTARMADVIAPALIIGLILSRIGDIINGEHCTEVTSAWWGFIYTHPASLASNCYGSIPSPAMHPAVVYEMLWIAGVLAVVWWGLKDRLRPEGMLLAAFFALYAFGRFFIAFYHTYKDYVGDLNEVQLISLAVLAVTVPLLAVRARLGAREVPDFPTPASPARPVGPRAQRRRQMAQRAKKAGR
jgi:phosphatidylglycerol:prolipoprotein diacylglycerol transferase